MRKLLATLSVLFAVVLVLAAPAGAQDETVIGSVEVNPPLVPEAGTYDLEVTGTGFIPDTDVVVGTCTAPGDTLVFGESSTEEITAAVSETLTGFTTNCDLANLVTASVDSSGNVTATFSGATVGDNLIVGVGALDQSQGGGTWVPIGDPAAAQLAVTGVDSWTVTLFGIGLLALGAGALYGSRRFELA